MYKALITDLDGTAVKLSSDGSDIDSETQKAIQDALQSGKKITCATGREWEFTKNIVQKLGFVSPCIVEGGTRIVDPLTEETLWEKSLTAHAPEVILNIFKSFSSRGFIVHSSDITRQTITDVKAVPDALRFLYLLGVDKPSAIKICNQINTIPDATAHITPSWIEKELVDIHVTHSEATKEHAIHIWQKLEGATIDETIGMGDSGNDKPIFLASGYKVAVGNATAELKELADYIAPSVKEHPLAHVIKTLLA